MKLFVNYQGKILGPLDWEKILFAAKKGRFAEDVTVSDDRVNWISIDDARKLFEKSKTVERKEPALIAPSSQHQGMQAFSLGTPKGGYPGGTQGGTHGDYPGGAQGGYPGGAQGGYPGGAQGGYPDGAQGGYPGGAQSGYQGMQQMNGMWNGVPNNAAGSYRQSVLPAVSAGIIIAIIIAVIVIGGIGGFYFFMNRSVYSDVSKHIDLWLKAVQNGDGVSAYATDFDIPYSPVSWKIITDKSEFKAGKETYEVKLLMESSNKDGIPIRATWTLVIRRDKNRKTGFVITYVNVN